MKFNAASMYLTLPRRRSREGAWIEIPISCSELAVLSVAPVRERGLKLYSQKVQYRISRRSREGAWIEISSTNENQGTPDGRSREGAWIEMCSGIIVSVYPSARRSREGAWIEMLFYRRCHSLRRVAPARERGLKYILFPISNLDYLSLPQGSVD